MQLPTFFTTVLTATLSSAAAIDVNAASGTSVQMSPGIPSNCNAFYRVQPDDFCSSATLGAKFGNFTYTQLYKWNPDMGQGCYLTAYTTICVGTPDYVFVPPVHQPAGTVVPSSAIPVPIIANSAANCSQWEIIGAGMRGDDVIEENGITKEQLMAWNPAINATNWENGLFAEYWYCVGV